MLAAAVVVAAAGCVARVPIPPYSLAFLPDLRTPHVLRAGNELAVPMTLRNTGTREWDASRVHLSYHWLWLLPRELFRPSRTVPYHDGIRTELSASIPPGAEVRLDGRLLAPDLPGLYWLQWDMVDEGATWFAQVSPRQPRHLVVVLPTLSGLFAPLPLLTALVGAVALRRSRPRPDRFVNKAMKSGVPTINHREHRGHRDKGIWVLSVVSVFITSADVLWCAAMLWSKPLILVREALLEPTGAAYWLMLIAAVGPPVAAAACLPRGVRPWMLLGIGTFVTLLILGDTLYYRFFNDVLSVPAMLGIRQTRQVSQSIRSLITPAMFWLVVDIPAAMWLAIEIARAPSTHAPLQRRRVAVPALAVLTMAAIVPSVAATHNGRLDQIFRDRAVMEQLGPLGYHCYDAWTYVRATLFRPPASEQQIADAREWFASRASLRAGSGPVFGAALGKNLIVVQVESLQDFVIDFRVGGQAVMPHLAQWTRDALRFANVTDQTNQGRTSDAEFTTLTSLLPLDQGAAAFRYAGDHYVGLPRVLTQHGYSTLSAVPFEAGFWNRRVMHPAYGFQQSLFEADFRLTDQIGWGLNDRDFLQQMVPQLTRLQRPFAAWLITLSLHHPFENFPDKFKTLSLGALDGTSFGNYLHAMNFFDAALDQFRQSLQSAGLLDESVLVVFGDHDAGFPRDKTLSATIGIGSDDVAWTLNDRIPLFIRLPAGEKRVWGVVETPAGQTDLAPTLLALLGVDPAKLPYIGRNLLGQPDDAAVLRPYGEWIDRRHLLIKRNASAGGSLCYSLSPLEPVDSSLCAVQDDAARRARNVGRFVVAAELQQRLRESLR